MASLVTILTVLFKVCLAYLEVFYRLFVPIPKKNIKGKVVLVTGAGRGIGKCLAAQFAQLGCKLILWDINEEEVKVTANEIKATGGIAFAYKCDVISYDAVRDTANSVKQDIGHVDIVVNNAGIMLLKKFIDLTERDVRRTMDINIISHFWINQQFLPAMLEKNDGHIVTIASMAGKAGGPLMTDYAASKFGAVGYSEALASEIRVVYKKPGVKVTTVCPMFVNTNLIQQHEKRIVTKTGGDPIMEPNFVAAQIIEGMLLNKAEVYLPAKMATTAWMRVLFPLKALIIIADAVGVGFSEKTKAE